MDDLGRRVDHLEDATGVKSEPTEPEEPTRAEPRCPGCRLPVEEPRRSRCVWCGFVFSAAPKARRGRRRAK